MSTIAMHLEHEIDFASDALRRTMAKQLARLPALQARAFTLREIEGLPPARICALLGVSEEALGDLLYEARVAMCGALAGAGFGP